MESSVLLSLSASCSYLVRSRLYVFTTLDRVSVTEASPSLCFLGSAARVELSPLLLPIPSLQTSHNQKFYLRNKIKNSKGHTEVIP